MNDAPAILDFARWDLLHVPGISDYHLGVQQDGWQADFEARDRSESFGSGSLP